MKDERFGKEKKNGHGHNVVSLSHLVLSIPAVELGTERQACMISQVAMIASIETWAEGFHPKRTRSEN